MIISKGNYRNRGTNFKIRKNNIFYVSLCFLSCILLIVLSPGCVDQTRAEYLITTHQPQVSIDLKLPQPHERIGGLITAELDGKKTRDFIITSPKGIAAYTGSGEQMWIKDINIQVTSKAERDGLPGKHGPGIQASDFDENGDTEILFLTEDSTLQIVKGITGEVIHKIKIDLPQGAARWEHLVIANFRGQGDRDLLLQATNAEGYRMGRYLAAYSIDDLLQEKNPEPLWTRDDFIPNAHSGARIADLDGDGKDEVLGGTIVSSQGNILFELPIGLQQRPHIDSIYVADVRPDIPGLEVVALEEGLHHKAIFSSNNPISKLTNRIINHLTKRGERVFLYNAAGLIWETHYKYQEPQNAAVGDFDPNRPGLEIWCRSRYNKHQKPFVFDARGKLIANYEMDKVAPEDWTVRGVEVIFTIDWTGEPRQLAVAKERHKSGDVAIFDPISGQFLYRFQEEADRLYVADVSGDWREELIVLNGNQLRIYSNPESNQNPNHPRLWTQNHYRRSKMTWNYYNS